MLYGNMAIILWCQMEQSNTTSWGNGWKQNGDCGATTCLIIVCSVKNKNRNMSA